MSTLKETLQFTGIGHADIFTKDGVFKERVALKNAPVNQGKNNILDTYFNGLTQISAGSWYIGLIDGTGFPALAPGDTLTSHTGWTENTSYSGSRPAWGQGSASAQAVTNASPITYTITGAGTLYGIFVCGVATGTSGPLWSTAAFTTTVPIAISDQIKITYTLSL